MEDLILLPTLERLRPYDKTGFKAYGLTLSVALGESKKKLADLGPWMSLGRSFLQPWSWKKQPAPLPASQDLIFEIEKVAFFSLVNRSQPKLVDVQLPHP